MDFISATEEHYPAIASLVTSPEELYLVCPTCRFPWDVAQLKAIAAQRHSLTVGMANQQVVAFSNLYDLVPQQSAFIGNVIVGSAYRGQGVGKRLIHHMITLCQTIYRARPHLSVFNDNTPALLLYFQLGFVPYDLEPRVNLKGDKVALIHMRYRAG